MNKLRTIGVLALLLMATVSIASAETLRLTQKDTVTWAEISGETATLIYNPTGTPFSYTVDGKVPMESTEYALIYYADVVPTGSTTPGVVGKIIAVATSDATGTIHMDGTRVMESIPYAEDANSFVGSNSPGNPGAKIWLVPTSDIIPGTEATPKTLNWNNFANYLFEENMVGAVNGVPSELITYTSSPVETLRLVTKNLNTWFETNVASAKLTYHPSGSRFVYELSGTVPSAGTVYSLIYYKDAATNPTTTPGVGVVIGTATSDGSGKIVMSGTPDTKSMPQSGDANYPDGAKLWLVPSNDITGTTLSWTNFANYLFEENLRPQGTEVPETSQLITYTYLASTTLSGIVTAIACPVGTIGLDITTPDGAVEFGQLYPGQSSTPQDASITITATGFVNPQLGTSCEEAPSTVSVSVSVGEWIGVNGNTMPASSTVIYGETTDDLFVSGTPYSLPVATSTNAHLVLELPENSVPDTYTQTITVTQIS